MQLIQPNEANKQHHEPTTTDQALKPPSGKSDGLGPPGGAAGRAVPGPFSTSCFPEIDCVWESAASLAMRFSLGVSVSATVEADESVMARKASGGEGVESSDSSLCAKYGDWRKQQGRMK